MDEGILLLRLMLGVILLAHAGQKSLGWFQGRGLTAMGETFESLGLRPGRAMVLTASAAEVTAALSLISGFLTPLGAVCAAGTMTVAGLTMQLSAGKFWNAAGGGEYPYVLAFVAVVNGFTGPGRYSLDALIARAFPGYSWFTTGGALIGVGVGVIAAIAAIPFVRTIRRSRAGR